MATTLNSSAQPHYAREDRDIEACYEEKLESIATIINDTADIVDEDGKSNKISIMDGTNTTGDDSTMENGSDTDDEVSTTLEEADVAENGQSKSKDDSCPKIGCIILCIAIFSMVLFMQPVFVIMSDSSNHGGFGNFWHLFAGGCLIVGVLEFFILVLFGAIMEKYGWDQMPVIERGAEVLADLAATQVFLYLVSFTTLVIGARLQHSYHYFH